MTGVDRQDSDGLSTLRAGGAELARYITTRDAAPLESPRPYLHPIRTLGGRVVSGYRPADHDWHWGLSIAIANIDVAGEQLPVNLWGGVTYTHGGYEQLDNNGDQVHEGWDADGTERVRWRTASGRPFVGESRSVDARVVQVTGGGSAWRLDLGSEWTNLTDGDVTFGSPTTAGRENAGYGGLFLRAAPEFRAATVLAPTGPVDADAAMGRPTPWLALATDDATVALAADPRNPRAESPFFVRTGTPMLCAAPFFHSTWSLAAGETALWRWSLLVSDGRLDTTAIAAGLGA
jgi:hypothetical protein